MKITDKAIKRLEKINKDTNKKISIKIDSGGCSGFSYRFELVDDDEVYINDILVTDEISKSFIENSTLDFIEDLSGLRFDLKIPEAKSQCGCGTSFSI